MACSFEEIRSVTLDILAGRESVSYEPNQYEALANGVAEVLARREGGSDRIGNVAVSGPRLSGEEADLFLEVFWSLFQQGIIVLGYNRANNNVPWCRLSLFGKRILENNRTYFFHDVSSYESEICESVSNIDATTLLYLKEAMQAFRSGCMLSATVMLGVATEHTFLLLLQG